VIFWVDRTLRMRLRRSLRLGMESYRTADRSIVIPAKADMEGCAEAL